MPYRTYAYYGMRDNWAPSGTHTQKPIESLKETHKKKKTSHTRASSGPGHARVRGPNRGCRFLVFCCFHFGIETRCVEQNTLCTCFPHLSRFCKCFWFSYCSRPPDNDSQGPRQENMHLVIWFTLLINSSQRKYVLQVSIMG